MGYSRKITPPPTPWQMACWKFSWERGWGLWISRQEGISGPKSDSSGVEFERTLCIWNNLLRFNFIGSIVFMENKPEEREKTKLNMDKVVTVYRSTLLYTFQWSSSCSSSSQLQIVRLKRWKKISRFEKKKTKKKGKKGEDFLQRN